MKRGKAVGPAAEASKADTETTAEMLHPLFKKIWEEEQVPKREWKEGYLIKIPKEGNLGSCLTVQGLYYYPSQGRFLTGFCWKG